MIAFITGGSSGIGAEFARRFAEQGYDLIISGRRKEQLDRVAEEIRTKYDRTVTVIIGDLTDPGHLAKLVELIKNNANIDVLINNAGLGLKHHFIDDDINNPDTLLDVHLRAAMHLMHAAIPGMTQRKRGTIINVSSIAGFSPTASDPTYGATKAFLTLFTESLHLVLHEKGITVQALCPGFTWTNFHEKLGMPKEEQQHRGILRWTTVDKVVDASLKGLRTGTVVVIPGFLNRVAMTIVALLPRRIYYLQMRGKTLRRR
jgi:short-subunit dehydrogenase